jgi:DUF1009 family protein
VWKLETVLEKNIALIAGDGELPVNLAKNASESGHEVTAISLCPDNKRELEKHCKKVFSCGAGEAGKILNILQSEGLKQLTFIGKVSKTMLLRNLRLDSKAISILKQAKRLNDDSLMILLIDELKQIGVDVIDQTLFLREYFPQKGVIGKHQPDELQQIDIEYGFQIAKAIGGIDLGQTVVVQDKMVLAVEAIEGTDRAIERGCKLGSKKAVVVKVAKPEQDKRFDVPAVGMRTLKNMQRCGGKVLAIEAGETFVVEKEKMIEFADKHKMVFIAV